MTEKEGADGYNYKDGVTTPHGQSCIITETRNKGAHKREREHVSKKSPRVGILTMRVGTGLPFLLTRAWVCSPKARCRFQ